MLVQWQLSLCSFDHGGQIQPGCGSVDIYLARRSEHVVQSDKTLSLLLIPVTCQKLKSLNPVYLPLGQIRRPEYFIWRLESNGSMQYYGAHRYIHVCVEIILLRCRNIIIIERGIKRFKSADRILEICLIRPSSKYADSNF
jgi:hypothetical protein